MDFETYAVIFALSHANQAEVALRVREDGECNAAKQVEAEAARAAKDLEHQEKANVPQERMAATAAKLKKHRRRQQGEPVESQVLRIGQECRQAWPTDEEVRHILKKDRRSSGTVYGTHYDIRFTREPMVLTPVLLAESPGDIAQAEFRDHNPFASRSMVTSTPTLPTQGPAGCHAEGELLGQHVA